MLKKRHKVLLTGGSGMVGRNIQEHPSSNDWDIRAPRRSELNLADYDAVLAWMHAERPRAVIHAAGRVGGIQANIGHPVDFLVENVDLGRNVIMAAKAAGVPSLLNLASSCMYPRLGQNPLAEGLILAGELEPTNEGYALAKIFATRLCQYIRREEPRLNYKTLIPCNLFGRHDKFSPEHSHLLPAIIHKIHNAKATGQRQVDIWGDGTARREFMYAGDLADIVLRALAEIEALPDLMNVGLGHDYSINEYYEAAARVIGWRGEFAHDRSKPVGMQRKQVDISLQTQRGWRSATSLDEGIRLTYEYYLEEVTF